MNEMTGLIKSWKSRVLFRVPCRSADALSELPSQSSRPTTPTSLSSSTSTGKSQLRPFFLKKILFTSLSPHETTGTNHKPPPPPPPHSLFSYEMTLV